MKFGVVTFPGSNCDHDLIYALKDNLGQQGAQRRGRLRFRGRGRRAGRPHGHDPDGRGWRGGSR